MQLAFDALVAGGKAGQFELKDMARYLPSLAPAAKALGLEGQRGLESLVAMLQVIRKGSGTSEEAASSMQNILQKMQSEETTKRFKKMASTLRRRSQRAEKKGAIFSRFSRTRHGRPLKAISLNCQNLSPTWSSPAAFAPFFR